MPPWNSEPGGPGSGVAIGVIAEPGIIAIDRFVGVVAKSSAMKDGVGVIVIEGVVAYGLWVRPRSGRV
jgi:hypothetical protein